MFRRISLYKIAFINALAVILLLLVRNDALIILTTKIIICLLNAGVLIFSVDNHFSKRKTINQKYSFAEKKRTFLAAMSSISLIIVLLSIYYELSVRHLCIMYISWTVIMVAVHLFDERFSRFVHILFKKNRRIAIVGYDDNAHKLAEKFKKQGSNKFVSHLPHKNADTGFNENSLFNYIDFAKQHRINELYISVPEHEDSSIAVLAEEAERHCIRVNFIAHQEKLESGFYHLHYIGGLPVLKRFREPLRHLHKQILKRSFDIIFSSLVIVLILSWLIPLVTLLIKLESKGPVFFKQSRSGRNNATFTCLKFRSMHPNLTEAVQATKNDKRVTKVGAFLRKTNLDEFPQFLNVFMGDMSIVGPRPHMLQHTVQYSDKVNHYMVRLYLKPGLTGWAQVNGYRGEVKNIQFMETRVEHDIWYMENWSLLLDIKIMFLTFINIIKGEENAY